MMNIGPKDKLSPAYSTLVREDGVLGSSCATTAPKVRKRVSRVLINQSIDRGSQYSIHYEQSVEDDAYLALMCP